VIAPSRVDVGRIGDEPSEKNGVGSDTALSYVYGTVYYYSRPSDNFFKGKIIRVKFYRPNSITSK
jgi:hypothetical protein